MYYIKILIYHKNHENMDSTRRNTIYHAEQAMIKANTERAKKLAEAAGYLIGDPIDQVASLLTAATLILERKLGPTEAAASALTDMLAPTLEHWSHMRLVRGGQTH